MLKKGKRVKKTRILAINFGGIGDEILFFPTLKALKSCRSNSYIDLVTEPRSKYAKELTNLVRRVITCDIKRRAKYLELLKLIIICWFRRYKIVVSSGSSKLIPILLFLTGIRKRYGYDTGTLSKLLLTKAIPLNKSQYAACMYHDLTKGLCDEKSSLPEIDIRPENLVWANEKIGSRDKQIITIHPGVSKLSLKKNMVKSWPAQNWVNLIIKLLCTGKYKVILTGGPDDEAIFLQLKAELASYDIPEGSMVDLYGQTQSISQLAAVISQSNLMVCVDSAPMHVAVGVRTPALAIFGPTDEKKLLPSDERFTAIRDEKLECRPCLWDKRQTTCDYLDCLNIDPETVFQAIEKLLGY